MTARARIPAAGVAAEAPRKAQRVDKVGGPRCGDAAETSLTVAGAVLLCAAHLRNRACRHRCHD